MKHVRKICNDKNIVLIFDECTTGFRQSLGGLHKEVGINPDIAIFGKALGNGFAITALIGKERLWSILMKLLSAVLLDRKNWSNSSFGYYKIYGAKKDLEKNKKNRGKNSI